ncbi:hypothetical protein [Nisaea sediminum]|uniref:hypothetical protein n=1 Tax=Nisaea sediminum TaxID=2775867 RepID=UPI0018664FF0|nr:hypothetical protein [Nisaea sediminum]
MKRGLIIAALPLVLGGCLPILPPAIQLATTGLSGIAFLATGKSTTDHLISAAVDEDCSMLRVAFGDKPCQEYTSDHQKPLTEIVAYYPGDADDWIDRASIPKGEVSGSTMLAMSTVGDPDVRGRNRWPGTQETDTLLVEAPVENTSASGTLNEIDAGVTAIKDLTVTGFVPATASLEPQPLKLKSVPATPGLLALPVSSDVSWRVKPEAPALSARQAPEPVPVEAADRTSMTVLPVLRPARAVPGKQTSKTLDLSETFTESGLAGTDGFAREQAGVTLLQDSFASGQGAATTQPVIMSVRLKGSLLHRFAGGAFSRYDAVAATSGFEPMVRRTN